MSKRILTRIQQKHDVEANWNKATSFVPLAGEVIIYEPDENYTYARFKIGDGETFLTDLPFNGENKADIHSHPYLDNNTKYAASESIGGSATSAEKVNKSLTIQLNGGTTEGTNKFTFDGSSAKTINVAPASHSHSSYVNQNAFSAIAVNGQTSVAADTTSDTLTFAGSNVSITTDAAADKVTFSVADGTTSTKGIVQLTDSVSSDSTTTAATPNSVKQAYDQAIASYDEATTATSMAYDAQVSATQAQNLAEEAQATANDAQAAAIEAQRTADNHEHGSYATWQSYSNSNANVLYGIIDGDTLIIYDS